MKHILLLLLAVTATSVSAADWPRFHGSKNDNVSPDKGLLKSWPEGGPQRIWEASGIGEGYSSVAIVGDMIYTAGSNEDLDCVVTALNRNGETVWQKKNGEAWTGSYPGTRSTPTISDGLLYHLSGNGNLICLGADSGDEVWTVNILEKFDGRNILWGLSESPLVIGDKVICSPGGEGVCMVALDKKTGETIWKCEGTEDRPGYGSAILVDHDGLKQIIMPMSESIIGVRASDGERLWRYPHKVYTNQNITTPLFQDGFLIISACGKQGTTSLELEVSGDGCSVQQHWINETLDNKHGALVLAGGRIYGYAESQNKEEPWMCIDFKSGETIYQSNLIESSYKYPNACLTYADGMLYLYTDDGAMALAKPGETGFELAGTLKIEDPGRRQTWAHPVVLDGRLYLRCGDRMIVYDVADPDSAGNNAEG